MGEVRTKAIVANPLKVDTPPLKLDCLVDTGAFMFMLPKDVVNKLGISITGKAVVTIANEDRDEMDIAGPLNVTIGDRTTHCDCLVGPMLGEPLIGQLVLESLDLVVDSQHQTVTPRPESPAYPSYKLK